MARGGRRARRSGITGPPSQDDAVLDLAQLGLLEALPVDPATADPDLLDVCHTDAIDTIALPSSNGTIWSPNPARRTADSGRP